LNVLEGVFQAVWFEDKVHIGRKNIRQVQRI